MASDKGVRCFVPNCPFDADGLISPNVVRTIPICRMHAVGWQESELKRRFFAIALDHGSEFAERLFHDWAATEAQGLKGEELITAFRARLTHQPPPVAQGPR